MKSKINKKKELYMEIMFLCSDVDVEEHMFS